MQRVSAGTCLHLHMFHQSYKRKGYVDYVKPKLRHDRNQAIQDVS